MGTTDEERKQDNKQKPLKVQAIRNMEYYEMLDTVDDLYKRSKDEEIFEELMKLILTDNNIRLAIRNLKSNHGSLTPGTDGKNVKDYLKMEDWELIGIVKNRLEEYKPDSIKRVEIPKPGTDKKRPLGIPCFEDRLIQQCIKQILEPILEAKFYTYSFGFRPDRSVEDAIFRVFRLINIHKLHYVVDVDIKGFFDNVDHNKLKKQLWTLGIRDKKLLSILNAMLKAEIVMPDGTIVQPEKGTPQGGIISPLLANVVLNELDWWIASQWEEFPAVRTDHKAGEEYSCKSSKYRNLREKTNLKEMFIVRYADDFKIFTSSRKQAEKILIAVKMWLMDRLKLETAPDKSGITNIRKKCTDFLGFKIKVRKKGNKFVTVSHMSDKARKKVIQNLKEQIKKIQKSDDNKNRIEEINRLNSMILGIHEFYRLATNISQDLNEINKGYRISLYNRVLKDIKHPEIGEIDEHSALYEKYKDSKQVRYVEGIPIVPLAYCKTNPPMGKDYSKSRYTPEGRKEIHDKLGVNLIELYKVMSAPIHPKQTVEFHMNRISKFTAQYGQCAILGTELKSEEIHCHHIVPRSRDPNDSYENLLIVHKDIHSLIHSKEVDTIAKYLPLVNKDKKKFNLINKYRTLAGNFVIENVFDQGIQLSFFDQF